METIRYRFGGNSRKSGLATVRSGDFELRVLVLPKFWGPLERIDVLEEKAQECPSPCSISIGKNLSIVVREGTVLEVRPHSKDCAKLIDCFHKLIKESKKKLKGKEGFLDEETPPRFIKKTTEKTRFVINIKDQKTLLEKEVGLIDLMDLKSKVYNCGKSRFSKYWHHFLALFNNSMESLDDLPELNRELGNMSSDEISHYGLQFLLHDYFVQSVSAMIHHVRPGYVRVTKPSPFIRGRLDPLSAMLALAGAGPQVVCTYDEFGIQTPLLQVIVTALDAIVGGSEHESGFGKAEVVAREAGWLCQHLGDVHLQPRTVALRTGQALVGKLSRLDGDWLDALELAVLVLESQSLGPATGNRIAPFSWAGKDSKCFFFDINTDSFWERILRKILKIKKPTSQKSWKMGDSRAKAPDGIYETKKTNIIFDAKYKDQKGKNIPSSSDQHQAFVYSVIYKADRVFLVYADREQSTDANGFGERVDFGFTRCLLHWIKIPFPLNSDEMLSKKGWEKYLAETKKSIECYIEDSLKK